MGLDWTNRISFREHSIFCIRRIGVDRSDMGLPVFPNPCFGPDEPGLGLGCYGGTWVWHKPRCSFGLEIGILGPVLYPHHKVFLLIFVLPIFLSKYSSIFPIFS